MKTVLLLDADIIAFKIASVSQKTFAFPGCEPQVEADDWDVVVPRIDQAIADLKETLGTDLVIVCLSCPTAENWRLGVLDSYKGQRDYSNRPVHLGPVKDYMAEMHPSYRRPTLEADDIMGILSTCEGLPSSFLREHPEFLGVARKIIVSEDKDMATIPGWLYNPAKDSKPRFITEEYADRWHLYQAICGDTVDNYKGCPGAGHDKAIQCLDDKLLWQHYQHVMKGGPRKGQEETRWWSIRPDTGPDWPRVVCLFEKHGYTEADALVQARVARICRASDYDFAAKEVRLWTPSK